MRSLWFKRAYVDAILSGEKTDTIRATCRVSPGELVRASVGPIRPFATLEILSVESDVFDTLTEQQQADVTALYPNAFTCSFVRIHFRIATLQD